MARRRRGYRRWCYPHGEVSPPSPPPPSPVVLTYDIPGTYSFDPPEGVTEAMVECYGPGGDGGDHSLTWGGASGGGGGYARVDAMAITPLGSYVVIVGGGGTGVASSVVGDLATCSAGGGGTAINLMGGNQGQAVEGDVLNNGADGTDNPTYVYGTGGGGAGNAAGPGTQGTTGLDFGPGSGGSYGGGGGGELESDGGPGVQPGGGGGGGGDGDGQGGAGADGLVRITYFA